MHQSGRFCFDCCALPPCLRLQSDTVCVLVLLYKTDYENCSVTANIAGEADKDQLIVGAKHGFARLNQTTGKLSYIARPWEKDASKQNL
jgi:hypothetical protein